MRRVLAAMCVLAFVVPFSVAQSAGSNVRSNSQTLQNARAGTFEPLFQAMKQGDVKTIKQYLRGDSYEQYRTLLEHNTKYGEFLRSYYAGATFRLNDISARTDDIYVANISIEWTDGRKTQFDLEVSPPLGNQDVQGAKWAVGKPLD